MPTLPGLVRRGTWGRAAMTTIVAGLGLAASACRPEGPRPLRAYSKSYEFRISADPSPPRAREAIRYSVVVKDRETGQFITNGEGQIYATSRDRVNVYDSFEPAAEAGTYAARLNFIQAGDWNVAIRFRRDSTAALEVVPDWVQTVRGARPITERPIN